MRARTGLMMSFLPLVVGFAPDGAWAQTRPCPVETAQSYDRGTDPKAAGVQTAQSYDRGTDPKAAGVQTAQSYDRGTDPRAARVQVAQLEKPGTQSIGGSGCH